MGCDVADLPQWRNGLQIPFARFKRTQQIYLLSTLRSR
jgi:hypothetical protein